MPTLSRPSNESCRGMSSCIRGVPLAYEELASIPNIQSQIPSHADFPSSWERDGDPRVLVSPYLRSWIGSVSNEYMKTVDDVKPFDMGIFESTSSVRPTAFVPISVLNLESQCPLPVSNYMIHTMGINPQASIVVINRDIFRSWSMHISSAYLTRSRGGRTSVGIGGSFIRSMIADLGYMGFDIIGHVDDASPFVYSRTRLGPFFDDMSRGIDNMHVSVWVSIVCVARVQRSENAEWIGGYSLQIWCHTAECVPPSPN